jgi:Zn-dependent protease with chaperone function
LSPRSFSLIAQTEQSGLWLWVGLLVLAAAIYVTAWGLTWLGMFVALYRFRRSREAHWSVRARLATPGRRMGKLAFFLVVAPLLVVLGGNGPPIEFLPEVVAYFLWTAAGYIGVTQARLAWERVLNPALELTPHAMRALWIVRVSVLGILVVAGFVLFGLVSYLEGSAAWVMIGLALLGMGVYLSWGWVRLMRGLGIFRPASARLLAIVEQAAERIGVRPQAVDLIALPAANALAYPGARSIGVTDAAMAALCDDELVAVCAHELAHLGEPRWVRAVRLANGFLAGALVAAPSAGLVYMRNPLGAGEGVGALAAYVLVLVYMRVFVGLYRRMELRADAAARAAEPAPGAYARALERIYQANLVPLVISSRRHRYPELYDRLVDAGAPPPYPRPGAPPQWPLFWGFLSLVGGTTAACAGVAWLAAAVATW